MSLEIDIVSSERKEKYKEPRLEFRKINSSYLKTCTRQITKYVTMSYNAFPHTIKSKKSYQCWQLSMRPVLLLNKRRNV